MKLFDIFGEISVKDGKAMSKLKDVDKKAESIGSKMGNMATKVGKASLKFGALATVAGGALLGIASKTADALDRVDKMSQRLGMSTQAFQEWDFILSQSGVSIDQMQSGMKTLAQRAVEASEGVGKGAENFEKLGISVLDSSGQMKGQTELFEETITKLQNMESGMEKTALAQELFGRSGQELLPLLNSEATSIEELKNKAHELGIVQSEDAVAAGVEFADTLDQTTRMVEGLATEVFSNLLPHINNFLKWVQKNMPAIKDFFGTAFNDVIIPVVKTLWGFIDEFLLPILSTVFGWLSDYMPQIKEFFSATFGLAFDIISSVRDVIADKLIPIFQTVYNWAKDKFGFIGDAIGGAFGFIKESVEGAFDFVSKIIGKFKDAYDWAKKFLGMNDKANNAQVPQSQSSSNAMNTPTESLADGGYMQAGKPYIVGESETEVIIPNSNSMAIPSGFGGVKVDTMIVRNDSDINRIARELFNLQKEANRGYAL